MSSLQSRKWQLTINNPIDKGYDHNLIKEKLSDFKSLIYWCMSDEVGEEGTYHTHIYFVCSSGVRFETIKLKFEFAHIELARGTNQQNRDYVFKEGKWEKDKKGETNIKETQEEFGELPLERQGKRTDIDDLYDMIKSGMTNYQIVEEDSRYMLYLDKIERMRQILREDRYKNEFRQLDVVYIFGETGTGKTRSVMEEFGYENVYRVTDYNNPFDSYKGQDIIVFEEFRSSLKIHDMLKYLDGYPLELPCRYLNKIACYTKVYIISNENLTEQYRSVQLENKETWRAFLRRIKKIKKYTAANSIFEVDNKNLSQDDYYQLDFSQNPFGN